ncbi:MAG: MFS transporter [Campylobacterota bacterium]|nr:MFS transporter [Campylobacterota bacterium]
MNKQFIRSKVLIISFAHFAHDVFSAFLAPLLPLIIEKLGLSLSMVALLDIVRRIPALFNPLLGLVAEKRDVKYFVILTPAITAISMSLIGLAPSYSILIILLFVSGISSALFHIPSPTMVKMASGDKTGTGMSWYMVGGEFARTLGPILVTAGISWWGLEGIYKLMPIGIIASLILYIKLKDFETHVKPKKREKGDVKALLIKYRSFFITIGLFVIFQSAMRSSLTLYLPIYLIQNGESLWYAGIALSILQFSGVAGVFMSGKISDKIGRYQTLLLTAIGSTIFMALFIYFQNMFILGILGFFVFASTPVLIAFVQDTNSSMPTFMNSIYMSINFGISSFIVLGIGYLGDSIGLNDTFVICNVMAFGTILVALLFKKHQLRHEG